MYDEHHFIADVSEILDTLAHEGMSVQRRLYPGGGTGIDRSTGNDEKVFIDASRTVLELGHPTTSSIFLGFVTGENDLIEDNRVTVYGRALAELPPGRHSLALIVLAKTGEANESGRRGLNKHVLSCNRHDGVMVRMSSGRIWLRFSGEALKDGLTLHTVGRHILGHIKAGNGNYEAAEIIFVVGDRGPVERLRPVAEKQVQQHNDRYQSALVEKMTCETGLDCDQCPETETCKVLRRAVAVAR